MTSVLSQVDDDSAATSSCAQNQRHRPRDVKGTLSFSFIILYVMADDVTGNGCFISLSLLYVISNVTAEWIVLHRAVITAAHTCFECYLPRKVITKILCQNTVLNYVSIVIQIKNRNYGASVGLIWRRHNKHHNNHWPFRSAASLPLN